MGQRVVAEVERAAAVGQPAHDQLVASDHLLPVDPEVLPLLVRTAGDDQSPRDQRPGVPGPARLHRQPGQVDVVAFPDHFLRRRSPDLARGHVPQRALQHRHLAEGVAQPLGRFRLLEAGQQFSNLPQGGYRVGAHAPRDPVGRPEQVAEHGHRVTGRLLEEHGGPGRAQGTVADLRHLQPRGDLDAHPPKVALPLQLPHEVPQIVVFHECSRFGATDGG